jgi:predicted nucleic acid-binding protein
MNFTAIPNGTSLFVDGNTFIYYFGAHPVFGPACDALLTRIENRELTAFTSAQVLSDVAHRLMTLEAANRFGWPLSGMALRLKNHPAEVQQLTNYIQALDEITLIGIQVLPITGRLVSLAADVSRQTGLLSGDASIVVLMKDQGLTILASHDADFDRVAGMTRYSPA